MNQLPFKPSPEQALALYQRVVTAEGREPNRLLAKSALFQRLLDGKKPLVEAPPLSYSYPWYSIVEGDHPQDIDQPSACVAGVFASADGIDRVLISQALWEVLGRTGDESMTVTIPGWRERGFIWRAWREMQPAAAAAAYLISHNDQTQGRITTPAQLDAEAQYQAARWKSELGIVRDLKNGLIDEPGAISALNAGSCGATHRERFIARAARQRLQFLIDMYDARERDEIDDEEMQARIEHERTMLLGENWKVRDGELLFVGWRMKREAPFKLDASHYIDLQIVAEEAVNG